MAFPTLSRQPKAVSVSYEDNAIRHSLEAGYEFRRPRFTRNRKTWSVEYDLLSAADLALLLAHFDTVGTYSSFSWTDREGASHTVYYNKPLGASREFSGWYKIETIELMEV